MLITPDLSGPRRRRQSSSARVGIVEGAVEYDASSDDRTPADRAASSRDADVRSGEDLAESGVDFLQVCSESRLRVLCRICTG